MAPPPKATPEELESFKAKRHTIRIRITNVLKTWMGKKHSYDFEQPIMIEKIKLFLNVMKAEKMESHAQLLQSGIEKLKEVMI
jgi:hypothetical protein